jgi:hypothetical protein
VRLLVLGRELPWELRSGAVYSRSGDGVLIVDRADKRKGRHAVC